MPTVQRSVPLHSPQLQRQAAPVTASDHVRLNKLVKVSRLFLALQIQTPAQLLAAAMGQNPLTLLTMQRMMTPAQQQRSQKTQQQEEQKKTVALVSRALTEMQPYTPPVTLRECDRTRRFEANQNITESE